MSQVVHISEDCGEAVIGEVARAASAARVEVRVYQGDDPADSMPYVAWRVLSAIPPSAFRDELARRVSRLFG